MHGNTRKGSNTAPLLHFGPRRTKRKNESSSEGETQPRVAHKQEDADLKGLMKKMELENQRTKSMLIRRPQFWCAYQ